MEHYLNQIIHYLLPQNDIVLYIFLFLSAIVENLFPPIPGDTITAFGAFLVGTGRLNFLLVYLTTTFGSVCGFMLLFYLGRIFQRQHFIEKDYRFFTAESIIAAENWFSRFGYFVVLGNRFLPGVRSVISIVSGISRLKPSRVFLLSLASAAVWNLIWIEAGFMLGNNWDAVKKGLGDILRKYNIAAGIVIGAALAGFIVYRLIKKRRAR